MNKNEQISTHFIRNDDENGKHDSTLPQLRQLRNGTAVNHPTARRTSRMDMFKLPARPHSQTSHAGRQAAWSRTHRAGRSRTLIWAAVGIIIGLLVLTACSAAPHSTAAIFPPRSTPTPIPTTIPTPPPTVVPLPNCGEQTAVSAPPPSPANQDSFTLINTFPHDNTAFTQGLAWDDGMLIEGTGLYGQSRLRVVVIESGAAQQELLLGDSYFGEGITVLDDRIFQITWREQTAFVYDRDTLALENQFSYSTQGWGLADNGRCLIMSDGSSTLYFRDPDTFAELGRLTVADAHGPVTQINELEYIDGEIYANIWKQSRIARISPETGHVLGWLNLDELVTAVNTTHIDDVLNGIATNPNTGHLYVTGKRWPLLFEIQVEK